MKNGKKGRGGPPRVTSIEEGYERWLKGMNANHLAQVVGNVNELRKELARVSGNLDHLHLDVTALREVLRVPRPECYASVAQRKRAREVKQEHESQTPPPDHSPGGSDGGD